LGDDGFNVQRSTSNVQRSTEYALAVALGNLVFLKRFSRSAAANVKRGTKFTKNGEGHEEKWSLFVFFLPFFVGFVSFVLSRLAAGTLR